MQAQHKYARIERERRFLLGRFPDHAPSIRTRRIIDRYLDGTRLRLREQHDEGGAAVFKLAQKIPARGNGSKQGLITNLYLSEAEFLVLARLPAKELRKTRYSIPPFGIDVFEGELAGLVLAEAEFDSDQSADSLTIPDFFLHEVTNDDRFTGGRLVRASREVLRTLLLEFQM